MAIAADYANGIRKGLGGFNQAVLAGLTNSQIAGATGVSNLRSLVEALSPIAGTSSDDLVRASDGIQMAADAGVLNDTNVQASATATAIRALFTAELSELADTYTGDSPQ